MSCVLRISGSKESIQRLVERNAFAPLAVFKQGINIEVSRAGFNNLDGQIQDAIAFLDRCGDQLYEMCQSFGIEGLRLDFALAQSDDYVQGFYFPADLLFAAGQYGIDIEVSLYPLSNE